MVLRYCILILFDVYCPRSIKLGGFYNVCVFSLKYPKRKSKERKKKKREREVKRTECMYIHVILLLTIFYFTLQYSHNFRFLNCYLILPYLPFRK